MDEGRGCMSACETEAAVGGVGPFCGLGRMRCVIVRGRFTEKVNPGVEKERKEKLEVEREEGVVVERGWRWRRLVVERWGSVQYAIALC